MESRYYFCCSLPLEVRSVIKPGNWWRIICTYTPQTHPNSWLLAQELTIELVRREAFAAKPSRFDSLFLCMNEADLNEFMTTNRREIDLKYEVELLDPNAPSHIGDWTLYNIHPNYSYEVLRNRAQLYWEGNRIVKPEFVTLSSVRITRIL